MKKTKNISKSRSSKHSKTKAHSSSFAKVYWPYLPAIALLLWGFYAPRINISHAQSKNGVLAYATNTSISGLLTSTNAQRAANGASALTLNSKLTAAAQAKANDMATRNYWSHNTPEGNPPWVFIQNAGYSYNKAGENLAYGFLSSDETVTGWMNSPSHKANLLDTQFKEVGFGIANNADYQSNGENTIVVAEYGDPYVYQAAAAPTPSPTPTKIAAVQSSSNNTPAAPTNQSDTLTPNTAPSTTPTTEPTPTPKTRYIAYNTSTYNNEFKDVAVSRLQALTNGNAPWVNYMLITIIVGGLSIYFLKHAWAVKKVLVEGEEFIIKHPLIDIGIIALVSLAMYALSQAGRVL